MGRVRSLRLGLLASGLGLLTALGGLLLLVACGGTPAPPPPLIANFTATRSPITAGTSTTLVATFTNGAGTIDQDVGAVASGAPVSVTPVADTTYILTVINTAGMVAKSSTRVTLVPAPVATSLWATMNPELYGGSTTITPTFSAGTGSVDQGVGVVTNGVPFSSGPITAAKTFTLTVTNSLGTTATKSLTLTPVGVSLGAISPGSPTVTTGTTKTFSVLVSGGATNTVTWSATAGTITSGGVWTAPATVGTATITATSSDDPSAKTTTTVTTVAAPVATSLVASTQTPAYGTTFTLTPTYANGTGTLSNTVACPPTGVASGAITANWSGARTYTLTLTNAAGTTATATTAVTPQTVAVAAFTAGAPTVTVGATQAFSTTATGGATNALVWSSTGGTWSGSTWTAPATPGTYTITATSSDDTSKTAATTVTVVAAPAISSFSAAQSTLTAGASTTLTAVFANGTGAVNNSVGTVTTATAKTVTPASTTTYTLTVTNAAGSTATATCTVTVVPAPVAYGFVASTASPAYGATFTLTATYEGGVGSIAGNTGPAIACPASGLPSAPITADWSGIRAYTLTITNAAGARDASIVVSVIPQTVAFTGITPATPSVTAGYTQAFTATVTGGVTNTVTWDSSGQGTWSGNTWTAPATPGTVTITATSVDDPTKTFGVTAAVVAPVPISGNLSAPEGPAATIRSPKLGSQEESLASASFAIPTALPPMGAGITINLIQIDNAGLQVGAVIATCLTDASGNYSLQAPAGFVPGPSHAVQALIPANGSTPAFTLLSFVTSTTANNIDPYTHATFGLVTTSITTGGGTLAALGNGAVLAIQGTVYSNMGNVPSSALTTSAMLTALQTAMTQDEESKNSLANLAAPFGITGTVKNLAGEPLAGIGVGVCSFGGLTLMGVTQTAVDGTYTVRVPAGDYVVGAMNLGTASFAASGWWSATGPVSSQFKAGKVTVSAAMVTKDFALIAGGRLSGSLTGMANPTDVPLPGMQIALCDFASGQTLASASTGPDGTFVFNVAPGTYYVSVRNKTRYVPYGSANFMDTPPVGTGGGKNSTQATKITVTAGVTQSGSMRLWPGHKISGTVLTNSGGSPVVGIPVRFQDATAGLNTPGAESTRTDVDGQYRLWLQPGSYNALCRGQSATALNAGVADVVQNFSASVGKITMKLVDSGNHPISQARGDLYDGTTWNGLSQEISNSEGILEMYTTTPAQTVKLGFSVYTNEFFGSSAYNGTQTGAAIAISAATNLISPDPSAASLDLGTVTLPDGAILTGYVRDTSTPPLGRPNIMVQVRYGGTAGSFKLVNTRTKSDGSYTVTLPAGITLRRVVANPGTSPSQQFDNIVMGVAGTTKTQNFAW